jgi:hypothetical protein
MQLSNSSLHPPQTGNLIDELRDCMGYILPVTLSSSLEKRAYANEVRALSIYNENILTMKMI